MTEPFPPPLPLHPGLRGRVAVVTGGSGVLGGAMAGELARQGAVVAIVGRSLEKARAVAARIGSDGGVARGYACDVLDEDGLARLASVVHQELGPVTLLVNAAGGGHPAGNTSTERLSLDELDDPDVQTFFNMDRAGFDRVMDLNFTGTWLPCRAFARDMSGRPGASIVNISSMAAGVPATKVPAYSAAKAAVDNFTRWLAVYLVEAGVRVNAIAPGFFLTEQNRRLLMHEDGTPTERAEKIIGRTPMRRFGRPHELLGALLWLVDADSSGFVTGTVVPVDGGFLAYSGV